MYPSCQPFTVLPVGFIDDVAGLSLIMSVLEKSGSSL